MKGSRPPPQHRADCIMQIKPEDAEYHNVSARDAARHISTCSKIAPRELNIILCYYYTSSLWKSCTPLTHTHSVMLFFQDQTGDGTHMQGLDTNTHGHTTARYSLKGMTGLVCEEILSVKGNKKVWKIRPPPPPQIRIHIHKEPLPRHHRRSGKTCLFVAS